MSKNVVVIFVCLRLYISKFPPFNNKKACRGSRDMAPYILNLFFTWKWVVNFTPQPLNFPVENVRCPFDPRLGQKQHRIIIIIIFINCDWVITRWQWLFYMYTNMEKKVTRKFKSGGLHERHVVATGNLGTISAFAYRYRETKENLCRGGRSQDLPDTDF